MDIFQLKDKAALIDHTNLSPLATGMAVRQLCREAKEHGFASVCILPWQVENAAQELKDSSVKVCTVIGFPLGGTFTEVKVKETLLAVAQGAEEIDMVINFSAFKEKKYDLVRDDIALVVKAAAPALVKVIIECCNLNDEEIVRACHLAVEAGAAFVKTSTGMAKSGAKIEDVLLMRQTVGPEIGVKAAGGIRSLAAMEDLLLAGANRIGTSSGLIIMQEYQFLQKGLLAEKDKNS